MVVNDWTPLESHELVQARKKWLRNVRDPAFLNAKSEGGFDSRAGITAAQFNHKRFMYKKFYDGRLNGGEDRVAGISESIYTSGSLGEFSRSEKQWKDTLADPAELKAAQRANFPKPVDITKIKPWRTQSLSGQAVIQQRALAELKWEPRHAVSDSKGNEEIHSTTRNYFGPTKYSLAKIDIPRPAASGSPHELAREAQWDLRHNITTSKTNPQNHLQTRLYFDGVPQPDPALASIPVREVFSMRKSDAEVNDFVRSSRTSYSLRAPSVPASLGANTLDAALLSDHSHHHKNFTDPRELAWDDRHHIHPSVENPGIHKDFRMYFDHQHLLTDKDFLLQTQPAVADIMQPESQPSMVEVSQP